MYSNRVIIPDSHYLRCQIPHCNSHSDLYSEVVHFDNKPQQLVQYALCLNHAVEYGYCRGCGNYVGMFALRAIASDLDGLCLACRNSIPY